MSYILILGGKGNLGVQLQKVLPGSIAWDRDDVDATNYQELADKIKSLGNISCIVNCIAFNDVDGAETNKSTALKLNAELPGHLAVIANDNNARLVQYSTGYVFSGDSAPYDELAVPDPVSEYARSKLLGEEKVQDTAKYFYNIRTNLLFGPKGQSDAAKPSVIDVMLKIGKEKGVLKGITDEFASFTYTPDLAAATKSLIDSNAPNGTYHIVNEGNGSWYDLAKEIFTIKGYKILDHETAREPSTVSIIPITAADYPRAAKRPTNSTLLNTKLPKLRSWQEALKEYLNK